jgi:hypothetical protein
VSAPPRSIGNEVVLLSGSKDWSAFASGTSRVPRYSLRRRGRNVCRLVLNFNVRGGHLVFGKHERRPHRGTQLSMDERVEKTTRTQKS